MCCCRRAARKEKKGRNPLSAVDLVRPDLWRSYYQGYRGKVMVAWNRVIALEVERSEWI